VLTLKIEKYKVETAKGTLQYNISGNGKPKIVLINGITFIDKKQQTHCRWREWTFSAIIRTDYSDWLN